MPSCKVAILIGSLNVNQKLKLTSWKVVSAAILEVARQPGKGAMGLLSNFIDGYFSRSKFEFVICFFVTNNMNVIKTLYTGLSVNPVSIQDTGFTSKPVC